MPKSYTDTQTLYDSVASNWDQTRNQSLFEQKWLDRVLTACPKNPKILYLGCGTAKPIGEYLINQGAQLTGIDFAPKMIAKAAQHFPDHQWHDADIITYETTHKFDAIISWSGIFHLSAADQRIAIPRWAKMLRPNGAMLLTTGDQGGEVYGTVNENPVYHASLEPDEYAQIFANLGFGKMNYVANDPDAGGHTLWFGCLA